MIDLRSDTATRPTPAMRKAMAGAEVGDDMFGEDPTINALQEEVAGITGKEAALFVSSGTMGNQLAIHVHTRPGDEVIVGEGAHPQWFEAGAAAVLSGVQFAVAGKGGLFTADEMEAQIKTAAYYHPRTRLVSVENTHNRAGGRVFPHADVLAIAERARAHGLALHLDGARLWNASVASGMSPLALAQPFETVSVCFSKGLGAPVGSALAGPRAFIEEARRARKMWGGAMRQAGVLGAAALYALRHHRERLAEDHANARLFADKLAGADGIAVEPSAVETNIVNVDVHAPVLASDVSRLAREGGLAISPTGLRRLRAVTHLDVSRADVEAAAGILAKAVQRAKG